LQPLRARLSFDSTEHHLRTSQRGNKDPGFLIALGLTVTVVGALMLLPALGWHDRGATSSTAGLDWRAVKREDRSAPSCFRRPADACIVVHGTGKFVALMGDSHAQMLIAPMTAIARAENWTLAVLVDDGCPWQDGLWRFTFVDRRHCLAAKAQWQKRVIPRLDPDIMVLINAPLERPGVKGRKGVGGPGGLYDVGSPAAEHVIEAATNKTVARFRADGRDVVIIEPIPLTPPGFNPLTCLSTTSAIDHCRFNAAAKPSATELYYRALARSSNHIQDLDLDRLVCPRLPICDPVVDGRIVWYDGSHLSTGYTRTLAGPIRELLVADGVASH
jgi:hypothetical protein